MPFTKPLADLFQNAGCVATDVPILQSADLVLNTTGEAFRARLFVTQKADGETLCLRPEFTIPVCLDHMKSGRKTGRYSYHGTVFRQRVKAGDTRPSEFQQAGVEALGEPDPAKADADMVALALEAVKLFPGIEPDIVIGDPAFFNAFVAKVGLPEIWRQRLVRSFGEHDLVDRALTRMVAQNGVDIPVQAETLQTLAEKGDEAGLADHVAALMNEHGLAGAGGRRADEIASRYLKKQAEARGVSSEVAGLCRRFLDLTCNAETVRQTFEIFGRDNDIDFSAAIDDFEARWLAGLSALNAPVRFSASFGRRLDYYTGFVFEILDASDRDKGPVAGGGRYDRLTEMLGGETVPAVGFSLWLDRLQTQGSIRKVEAS